MSGGVRPMAIEANPDGSTKRIFAQLSDLNGFAVVDFAERKEVGPHRAAEDRRPTSRPTPAATTSPSHGIGVTPDNKTLWVTSIPEQRGVRLFARRPEDGRPGRAAGAQAAGPRGDLGGGELGHLHAGLQDDLRVQRRLRSVTAIDTAAMKVKAVVRVGEVPKRINTLVIPGGPNASSSSNGRRASLH